MRGNSSVLATTVVSFALACLVAACDKGALPTVPSTANTPHPSGAVIAGSLTGSSVASKSTQSITGLTVSVIGTSITSTVDGSGHFVLTGVPAGDIQLRFHRGSIDATAMVNAVKTTDSITITVTITGSTAAIVSDSRQDGASGNDAGQGEASGVIAGLTGTPPTLTFTVGGTIIHTDANTHVGSGDNVSLADDGGHDGGDDNDGSGDDGGSLSLSILQNGLTVAVEGTKQSDGSILASEIKITTMTAKGTIAGLAGTCPTLHFTLGATTVTTTAATAFDEVRCSSLKNGTVVEVKGTQSGTTLTALEVGGSGGDL